MEALIGYLEVWLLCLLLLYRRGGVPISETANNAENAVKEVALTATHYAGKYNTGLFD